MPTSVTKIWASSIWFPNGSRHVKRGRPTSSVLSRVSTPRGLEPRPQAGEVVVDDEAEVRLVGGLLVHEHEVQLEVAAGAVPDESRRVELRQHVALLEPEQPAVERARPLRPVRRDRDRHVLERRLKRRRSQAPSAA